MVENGDHVIWECAIHNEKEMRLFKGKVEKIIEAEKKDKNINGQVKDPQSYKGTNQRNWQRDCRDNHTFNIS